MKKLLKTICLAVCAVLTAGVFASCSGAEESSAGSSEIAEGSKEGTFVITLSPEDAPITCENFQKLVESGFYDGLTFHRVIDGFMAQGGDPNGDGTGGTDTIKGEFSANGVDNKLSHKRGTVSMARPGNSMDGGSCQFFICYDDKCAASLDGSYAAFGTVTEGMDVVDDFLNVERTYNAYGELAVPVEPITIKSAKMLETGDGEAPKAEFTVTYTPADK